MPFFSSIRAIGPAGARRLLAKLKAFTDNFTRANSGSSIGQDIARWVSTSGNWGINSNRANTSTPAASYPIATFDAITQDAVVKSTSTGAGSGYGVSFWVTDENNWYGAFTEKSGFTGNPRFCNSPSHTLTGVGSENCQYPATGTPYSYPYGCCTGGGSWHNSDAVAGMFGCPNADGPYCHAPCSPVTCTGSGTHYSCPAGGTVSGANCNYTSNLTQWYRHQFKVLKKDAGTVSTLRTVELGNVTAVGTNIDSIQANTNLNNAVITASWSNGTSVSSTLVFGTDTSTPPKSSKFGMMYGPATLNQLSEIETFEYSPN